MQFTKKNFTSAESFPHDLVVEGNFVAAQKEHRQWVKDGVQKDMDVVCIFLQASCGVIVCRGFNPSYDFSDYKPGEKIYIPVNQFSVDNGVKTVTFRLG